MHWLVGHEKQWLYLLLYLTNSKSENEHIKEYKRVWNMWQPPYQCQPPCQC